MQFGKVNGVSPFACIDRSERGHHAEVAGRRIDPAAAAMEGFGFARSENHLFIRDQIVAQRGGELAVFTFEREIVRGREPLQVAQLENADLDRSRLTLRSSIDLRRRCSLTVEQPLRLGPPQLRTATEHQAVEHNAK